MSVVKYVEIIAPSSGGVSKKQLDEVVVNLQNLGFSVSVPGDLLDDSYLFFANSDEYRAKHLINALLDETIDIVWCLRGGVGAARLIPYLEQYEFKIPKYIVGYSDITCLHIYFQNKYGWHDIHGAVLIEPGIKNPYNITQIVEILNGQQQQIMIDNLIPLNDAARAVTLINGQITGGNLCSLQTGLSTCYQMQPEDKIIFIEEVNEVAYAMARTLEHLKQAKLFDNCKAVILGSFIGEIDKYGQENSHYAIDTFVNSVEIPVFKTEMFGHDYNNIPFIYGADCIIANDNSTYSASFYNFVE